MVVSRHLCPVHRIGACGLVGNQSSGSRASTRMNSNCWWASCWCAFGDALPTPRHDRRHRDVASPADRTATAGATTSAPPQPGFSACRQARTTPDLPAHRWNRHLRSMRQQHARTHPKPGCPRLQLRHRTRQGRMRRRDHLGPRLDGLVIDVPSGDLGSPMRRGGGPAMSGCPS